jgi:hypothetical protein
MQRMKETHAKKDDNVIRMSFKQTRRLGHLQQRVNHLDPNKKKYNRKDGKSVPHGD